MRTCSYPHPLQIACELRAPNAVRSKPSTSQDSAAIHYYKPTTLGSRHPATPTPSFVGNFIQINARKSALVGTRFGGCETVIVAFDGRYVDSFSGLIGAIDFDSVASLLRASNRSRNAPPTVIFAHRRCSGRARGSGPRSCTARGSRAKRLAISWFARRAKVVHAQREASLPPSKRSHGTSCRHLIIAVSLRHCVC
jgi:hypothetical protein